MAEKTYTVTGGYTNRDGKIMVFLKDTVRAVEAETAFVEGTSVRIVGNRAVRASR